MPRRRVLAWTLGLGAVVVVAAVFGFASSHTATGRAAPALPHESLSGGPVTLTSLVAGTRGRAAAVVFWASWCPPCAQEAPELERFARSAAGRGRIVGVDWSDPELHEARAFIRRYRWTFPTLRDAEGAVGSSYHLRNLPTTFIIDAHSRIRATLVGPQSAASLTSALESVERS
ncbi:MAG TPA: TlpA disulfide reductase family protein [Solirubrobacteraceae bacterium]|jgi:cytochrome c biogenesis protein CcmG/thiol:disulfide interchange protein DsbE|nr:TlpA disulfide reductase family protein [Solirubrobacteraceae bacterium]